MRVILPFSETLVPECQYSEAGLDRICRQLLRKSEEDPCYICLFDDARQHFLFLRAKQVYAAGKTPWSSTSIRDFFQAPESMNSPRMAAYGCDSRMLHSLLIPFQKKPELQVDTALTDLDELLNQLEQEGRSHVIVAEQDERLAILRYEKGQPRGLYLNEKLEPSRGGNLREEFLIRVYTLSAQHPVAVNVYSDLRVTYAEDAKPVVADTPGTVAAIFLARPPTLILKFKEKEIRRYNIDQKRLSIGRSTDNDIQVDNLGVSRTHCFIEEHRGHYYVIDNESLNGTLVNGQPIKRYCLAQGDVITIGKHTLTYRLEAGARTTVPLDGLEQTMFMSSTPASTLKAPPQTTASPSPDPQFGREEEVPIQTKPGTPSGMPSLRFVNEKGETQFAIEKDLVVFGSSEESDIQVTGFLISSTHAQIRKLGENYVLEHVGGLRRTKANGNKIKKHVLKDNDLIQIANQEFIYQE